LRTPGPDRGIIDFPDRVFHLEVLKGGMNRLLFRSNRNSVFPTRVEILFMNVKYLSIGTSLDGFAVEDVGRAEDWSEPEWRIDQAEGLHLYQVASTSGGGRVVAGSVTVDESESGPADPSRFFMMT
jgi:hypothetical protein